MNTIGSADGRPRSSSTVRIEWRDLSRRQLGRVLQRLRAAVRRAQATRRLAEVSISTEDARLFEEILTFLTRQYVAAAATGDDHVTLAIDLPRERATRWLAVARLVATYTADEEAMRRLRSPAVSGGDGAFFRTMLAGAASDIEAIRPD